MAPDLCGWTALRSPRLDSRWLAVKDYRLSGVRVEAPGRFSKVQSLVNKELTYQPEAVDVWHAPAIAWAIGYGDCEEFALIKRAILIDSGIPDEDLFFVLCHDLARHAPHAMLVARQAGKAYVMDIGSDAYPVEKARDYMPVAAFTGSSAWVYGRKG